MNSSCAKSIVANAIAISSDNSSPIFRKCVDCVAQILGMYPRAFKFSVSYLVEIVQCVDSSRFGNFSCYIEKQSQEARIADSYAWVVSFHDNLWIQRLEGLSGNYVLPTKS